MNSFRPKHAWPTRLVIQLCALLVSMTPYGCDQIPSFSDLLAKKTAKTSRLESVVESNTNAISSLSDNGLAKWILKHCSSSQRDWIVVCFDGHFKSVISFAVFAWFNDTICEQLLRLVPLRAVRASFNLSNGLYLSFLPSLFTLLDRIIFVVFLNSIWFSSLSLSSLFFFSAFEFSHLLNIIECLSHNFEALCFNGKDMSEGMNGIEFFTFYFYLSDWLQYIPLLHTQSRCIFFKIWKSEGLPGFKRDSKEVMLKNDRSFFWSIIQTSTAKIDWRQEV